MCLYNLICTCLYLSTNSHWSIYSLFGFGLGLAEYNSKSRNVGTFFIYLKKTVARGAWFSEVCSGRKTQETAVSKWVKCKMRITCV